MMLLFMLLFREIPLCYNIITPTLLPLVPCDIYKKTEQPKINVVDLFFSCCNTYEKKLCNNIIDNNSSYVYIYKDEEDEDHQHDYPIINHAIYYLPYKYFGYIYYDVHIASVKCLCTKYLLQYTCNNISYNYNLKSYPINVKCDQIIVLNFIQRIYLLFNNLIILNDKSKKNEISDNIIDNILILIFSLINSIINSILFFK